MKNAYQHLIHKLTRFYASIAVGLIVVMNGYNAYIDGAPWSHIFRFDFYFVAAANVGLFLLLFGFTLVSLRRVKSYFSMTDPSITEATALRELMRFPKALGSFFILGCLVFSVAYHFAEIVVLEFRSLDMVVFRHVMMELAAALSFSMLFSGVARIYITPCAREIAKADMREIKVTSFLWRWLGTFASIFLVIGVLLLLSIYNSEIKGGVNLTLVLVVTLVIFLFGFGVVRMLLVGFMNDLRTIIQGMDGLYTQKLALQPIIPVTARDETGELVEAFNHLHSQIEREYEGIRKDLQLAYEVQRYILPPPLHDIGSYQIVCHSVPAQEVGGDLYDVMRLSERQFAIMIGDVSGKGMPAALVMSAVISLFRATMRQGATAGEIMSQLNRQLSETLQGKMMVTLSIGIINMDTGVISYASAGHIAPYILSKDILQRVMVSSLPIGFGVDEVYKEQHITLQKGDCLVLLTDGVIEIRDGNGEMFGFERLEDALMDMSLANTTLDKLDKIQNRLWIFSGMEKVQEGSQGTSDDDWTIVLVNRAFEEGELS